MPLLFGTAGACGSTVVVWRTVALSVVLGLVACEPDSPQKPITHGPPTGGTDEGSTTHGHDGESEGGEETTTPTEVKDDLEIDRVTANQAVQVDISRQGDPVPNGMRTAVVITDRDLLIRAHLLRADDFEAREIKAVLSLIDSAGEEHEMSTQLWVDRDSADGDLTSTPWWLVPAEWAQPSTRYSVELRELDDTPLGDRSPSSPARGYAELGIMPDRHELDVVIVPVQHVIDGCDQTPELDSASLEFLAAGLSQVYPVDEVSFEVHEPVPWTESFDDASFSPLLDELSQLRVADQAPPQAHYYGLLWSCDGSPAGIDGQAHGYPEPVMSHDYLRVAAGKWFGPETKTLRPMIHELGHSLGRHHVLCRGDEGDPDPDYPYADGLIGAWGYGLDDGELLDPLEHHDFMTYCGTTWTSDYGWNDAARTIATLTSWEGRAAARGGAPVLVGSVYPDGTARWWITEGEPFEDERGGAYGLELGSTDGNSIEIPVAAATRPDSETVIFSATLPDGLTDVHSAVLLHGTTRLAIEIDGERHEP